MRLRRPEPSHAAISPRLWHAACPLPHRSGACCILTRTRVLPMLVEPPHPAELFMNFAKRNFILGLLLLSAPARSATVADWNHDLDLLVRDVATVDPGAFVKTPQRV